MAGWIANANVAVSPAANNKVILFIVLFSLATLEQRSRDLIVAIGPAPTLARSVPYTERQMLDAKLRQSSFDDRTGDPWHVAETIPGLALMHTEHHKKSTLP